MIRLVADRPARPHIRVRLATVDVAWWDLIAPATCQQTDGAGWDQPVASPGPARRRTIGSTEWAERSEPTRSRH
ncbi:MAG TPA: hypothetical protein VM388_02125 [Acidimicrobiales bacterium]|nr:hypothetical protein [Acidimicrobiales bacterium]HWI03722.1 hypothetical protein [Acidimicrobiales bacterium]